MNTPVTAPRLAVLMLLAGISINAMAQGRDADSRGNAMLAEHCTKCHNLDEVVRLRQTREQWEDTVYSMVARGAPIYLNEADQLVDYLSRTFSPDTPK